MGQASLGGWRFDIDPDEVEWDFRVKTAAHRTVGGKVVQVLGVQMGDMRVQGSFGSGGWQAQREFLEWFRDRARAQADTQGSTDFQMPQRKWHFKVGLKGLQEGERSVNLDVGNFAPRFTLTLMPTEDRSTLNIAKTAERLFISRISRDFGWEQTEYNGPMGPEEIERVLNGRDVREFLTEAWSPILDGPPVHEPVGGRPGGDSAFD